MKLKIHIVISLFLSFSIQAQNQKCKDNLSIYNGYVKTKNYEEAYVPWKMVYDSCPEIHKANYSNGERILKYKIKETTGIDKNDYINTLLGLYDNSVVFFPEEFTKTEVIINKVMLKYKHNMIASEAIYDQLSNAFNIGNKDFKNPKALLLFFMSVKDMYKNGEKEIGEVFEVYDAVTERITEENIALTNVIGELLVKEEQHTLSSKEAKKLKSYNSYTVIYDKILNSIDIELGNLADCENLIPFYENKFKGKKEDVTWIKKAVGRMLHKKCSENPIFEELFQQQLRLDPSADAFLYSGILKKRKGDIKGALIEFKRALELESDTNKKADIAYRIAVIYNEINASKSRNFAQKAITLNPTHGKAYLLIALLYSNNVNNCGNTPFEKRAMYWKAAEIARKAIKVQPSLKKLGTKVIESYIGRAPTKEMIFTSGMAGKTIYFKCWVEGNIAVPKLKN